MCARVLQAKKLDSYLKDVHDNESCDQAKAVRSEDGSKVVALAEPSFVVHSEKEGEVNTRNHNVTQTQHAELGFRRFCWVTGKASDEKQLDRGVEGLGHGDHDWREKHPKDVVKEEPGQKDHANLYAPEGQHLDSLHAEAEADHCAKEKKKKRTWFWAREKD